MLSSDDLTENKTCVVCSKLNSLLCPIKSNIVDSKRAISISVLNYTNSNILPRNLFQLLINSKYHISFQCTYPFFWQGMLKADVLMFKHIKSSNYVHIRLFYLLDTQQYNLLFPRWKRRKNYEWMNIPFFTTTIVIIMTGDHYFHLILSTFFWLKVLYIFHWKPFDCKTCRFLYVLYTHKK